MEIDNNVNYDQLKKNVYEDAPDEIFYTCPKCSGEYLDIFICKVDGRVSCVDCEAKHNGKKQGF